MPEEDKNLCVHDWADMYEGFGVDKDNPYIALMTFYCKKCLVIRTRSWPRYRYALSSEYLAEFEENKNNGMAGAA